MSAFSFVLEFRIRDGMEDEFRSFMRDMIAATEAEPGTIAYEWFLAEDGKSCHVYERYVDSASFLKHAESFSRFAQRCEAATTVGFCHVYGSPSDEVKEKLAGFRPDYGGQIGGFHQ